MKKVLFPIMLTALLTLLAGCSGLGRPLLDAAGAGGGAALAHSLSNGDLGITTAGAAGGALLSEGGQALVSGSQRKSFNAGYQKGQSDAVKTWYQQLRAAQRPSTDPASSAP